VRRTQVRDALVLRRSPLPSGDVVATLLSPGGTWRAIARKGRLPGGNLARLSLFHDVTVQFWRRGDDDLALITQVQLNGALAGLARPEAYAFAHLLAELADVLTVQHPVDERFYTMVASGLRGLHAHDDPEAVGLAYAWRLLGLAGIAPDVRACGGCGAPPAYLLVAEGTARCAACLADPDGGEGADRVEATPAPDPAAPARTGQAAPGPTAPAIGGRPKPRPSAAARVPVRGGPLYLGEAAMAELDALVRGPLSAAVHAPPAERTRHWRALRRFVQWHVGDVRALTAVPG
jgi:DNA repair protein RecO (recombination protein O)